MTLDGEDQRHESYGMIGISRIQGNSRPLYGSSIRHDDIIRLRVSRGSVKRNLNEDWYHAREQIVELDMSYSQFTEFILAQNLGSGVPCTLAYVGGKRMADPPLVDKQEQFRDEFKKDTQEVAKKLDALAAFVQKLNDKPTVTKGERAELLGRISSVRQDIASDMPFVVEQFHRQMDQSIKEAKGEIEGFAIRRIITAGVAAIAAEDRAIAAEDRAMASADGRLAIESPRAQLMGEDS